MARRVAPAKPAFDHAEDVFTPRSSARAEMFRRRNEADLKGNPGLQDLLREHLRDLGGQIVVYGDTGVGKSSLVKYAAADEGRQRLKVQCMSDMSYEAILQDAVAQLYKHLEAGYKQTVSSNVGAEVQAGLSAFLSAKGSGGIGTSGEQTFESVARRPEDLILAGMRLTGKTLLVLDNFQNIDSDATRRSVAQLMEKFADLASESGNAKIAVVGISEDAASLLGSSQSYQRRFLEVGVPHMPDDEVSDILVQGFSLLGMVIERRALDLLVELSDGFPYFAHVLGLQLARNAKRLGIRRIAPVSIGSGVAPILQSQFVTLKARLQQAYERGGEVRARAKIVGLLAQSSQRFWTNADVERLWDEQEQDYRADYRFISKALKELTDLNHGSILRRSGIRGRYTYRFADPHFRPLLRIEEVVLTQEVGPLDSPPSALEQQIRNMQQ